MEMMTHDCAKFAWGELVTGIWVEDGNRWSNPVVQGKTLSILKDTRNLKLNFVLNQDAMVWKDPNHKPSDPKPVSTADFTKSDIRP